MLIAFLTAWIFVVLGDSYDLDTHSWNPDGGHVIRQQDFWYVFGMTILYVNSFMCVPRSSSNDYITAF